jgi:hypothetical protein
MIYGPFSLANAVNGWMEFDMLLNVEPGYDYVWWGLSTDGSNFYGLPVSTTTTDFPNPVHELLNFREITSVSAVGSSNVWVGFYFHSDESSSAYYGAYIDNVAVIKAVCTAPSSPTLTAPASGTSGSDFTVSWSATSPLNTYELQEADNPSFAAPQRTPERHE